MPKKRIFFLPTELSSFYPMTRQTILWPRPCPVRGHVRWTWLLSWGDCTSKLSADDMHHAVYMLGRTPACLDWHLVFVRLGSLLGCSTLPGRMVVVMVMVAVPLMCVYIPPVILAAAAGDRVLNPDRTACCPSTRLAQLVSSLPALLLFSDSLYAGAADIRIYFPPAAGAGPWAWTWSRTPAFLPWVQS